MARVEIECLCSGRAEAAQRKPTQRPGEIELYSTASTTDSSSAAHIIRKFAEEQLVYESFLIVINPQYPSDEMDQQPATTA